MKSLGRITILAGMALVVMAFVSSPLVSAKTALTDEQRQHIQTDCQSIKSIVNQLHVNDALLRVNRGQLYESIATKLMDRFNGRLSSNDIDTAKFVTNTTDYRKALAAFRVDYVAYDQQLSKAMTIDCKKQPDEFNDAIESARELRFKVHNDVVQLNNLLTDYQNSVNSFLDNYQQATSGGKL